MTESVLLLVEDEPLVARALLNIMRSYAVVHHAASLDEARRYLKTKVDVFAMVVDLGLPDGNGLTVLEEVRRDRAHFPVLVYTGMSIDGRSLNRICELRATPASKDALDLVRRFAAESAVQARVEIAEAVRIIADKHNVTEAERSTLVAAVISEPKASFLARRKISAHTMRKQLELIGKRTGQSAMAFVEQVRFEVLRRHR